MRASAFPDIGLAEKIYCAKAAIASIRFRASTEKREPNPRELDEIQHYEEELQRYRVQFHSRR